MLFGLEPSLLVTIKLLVIYIYIFSYFYFKTRSPSESMVTYGNILSPPQWKVPAIFL